MKRDIYNKDKHTSVFIPTLANINYNINHKKIIMKKMLLVLGVLILLNSCKESKNEDLNSGENIIDTRIGQLQFTHDFENGYPTLKTQELLFNEIDFQRACQSYIWSIPLVSFQQWKNEQTRLGGNQNNILLYRGIVDKYGLLTANTTTPYALSFIDLTQNGPWVIEMPEAAVRGATHSMWQIGITQMTEAGKYVFYAPGTDRPKIDGAKIFEAPTNTVFFGIRLLAKNAEQQEADLAGIKIYPVSKIDNPDETKVIKIDNRKWEGWQPRGLKYFEILSEAINENPIDERDRFFMAMLKPLGIEKGKSFNPTIEQAKILKEASLIGEAMAKANDFFNPRLEQSHYADGSKWEIATASPANQRWENHEALDGRAAWFYEAVTNDVAMQSTKPGFGQIYLGSYRDNDNDWLDGGTDYVLNVPANVPAEEFWSLTIYDVSSRAPIKNEQKIADRSSRMDLLTNDDGSVTLYMGPTKPEGDKTKNWIPTVEKKAWFPYFRFYSPTETYFDRSWILPNIEKAK